MEHDPGYTKIDELVQKADEKWLGIQNRLFKGYATEREMIDNIAEDYIAVKKEMKRFHADWIERAFILGVEYGRKNPALPGPQTPPMMRRNNEVS